MSIPIATASPWPARAAYLSAAIFSAASGITNLNYGWSKGSDPASSLVWAGVAGAVAVVFALSWPAAEHAGQATKPLAGQDSHAGQSPAILADHREPLRPSTPAIVACALPGERLRASGAWPTRLAARGQPLRPRCTS